MRQVDLQKLEEALRKSWTRDTAYPLCQAEWSPGNPSFGQCAVTALIVQDFFGGALLFCAHQNHFWNRLADNREMDLTREQFPADTKICVDTVVSRDNLLSDAPANTIARTRERYTTLKNRVLSHL